MMVIIISVSNFSLIEKEFLMTKKTLVGFYNPYIGFHYFMRS